MIPFTRESEVTFIASVAAVFAGLGYPLGIVTRKAVLAKVSLSLRLRGFLG